MSTSPPPPQPLPSTTVVPGFRFHPTDEELVGYYLRRKVAGLPLRVDVIADVEIYRCSPWELPLFSRLRGRDRQWFFFSKNDRKYDGSLRASRATAEGFWKSTGKDRPVLLDCPVILDGNKVFGMRKSLVFHIGRAPHGRRTDWVMHEYRLEEAEKTSTGTWTASYVACRIFRKNGQKKGNEQSAPLVVEEWTEEEVGEVASPTQLPDVMTIAAAGEQEDGHSDDIEQGTTETICSIDQSTNRFEASSLQLNPPSEGLLAPGFRFHPTDEELVSYYLKPKVSGLPLCVDAIAEVNVYKWAPWDLPPKSRLSISKLNTEWYFFTSLDRKYVHNRFSHHNNRATAEGYWKSTGNDRPVRSHTTEKIIGMKKTLVFHAGRSPLGRRTDWVMHEYRLEEEEQNSISTSFVVCRIFEKSGSGPRKPRAVYGAPFLEEWEEDAKDLVPARRTVSAPDVIADVGPNVDIDSAPNVVVDAALEQNHACTSDNFEQGTAEKYTISSRVEIAYIREKVPVAWYTATVIKVVGERILLVEYETLKAEDDTLLSEIVSTQYIRPHPPKSEVRKFDLLDEVEAFYKSGWWPGVVAKVNTDSSYNVKFMHWEEEIEFNHAELRLLYDWVDGQWIQASQDKSMESQNIGRLNSVQQSSQADKSANKRNFASSVTPYSGNVDEAPSENNEDENSDRSMDQSEQECLPPRKKAKKGDVAEDNIQLSDSSGSETSKMNAFVSLQDKSIESQNFGGPKSIQQLSQASNTARECNFAASVIPSSGGVDVASENYENKNLDISTDQSEQECFASCKKVKEGEATGDYTRLLDSRATKSSGAVGAGFDVGTPVVEEEPKFRIRALVESFSISPLKKTNVATVDAISKPPSNILSGETNGNILIPDKSSQESVSFHKPLSAEREEHPNGLSGKTGSLEVGPYRGDSFPMVDCQQRKEPIVKFTGQGDKGAREHTTAEEKGGNCRLSKLMIIDQSLEGDSMRHHQGSKVLDSRTEGLSANQCGACTSDNSSEAQALFNLMASSSDGSLSETSASSVQRSEAGSETQNKVLPSAVRNHSAKSTERSGVSHQEQSPLPFEKSSSMWDSIESMEAFDVLPQQPHFHPLLQYRKDFREGMAIGLMVTFSNVVSSIDKLEMSDLPHKFDGILKTLVQLEAHGFEVQCIRTRVLELVRRKQNQDQLLAKRSAFKAKLGKENMEKELLNLESESIKRRSGSLELSLSHVCDGKGSISERRRETESKLASLEMDSRRVEDAILSGKQDFDAIRSALW